MDKKNVWAIMIKSLTWIGQGYINVIVGDWSRIKCYSSNLSIARRPSRFCYKPLIAVIQSVNFLKSNYFLFTSLPTGIFVFRTTLQAVKHNPKNRQVTGFSIQTMKGAKVCRPSLIFNRPIRNKKAFRIFAVMNRVSIKTDMLWRKIGDACSALCAMLMD